MGTVTIRACRLQPRERFWTMLTGREGVVAINRQHNGGEHVSVELEPLPQVAGSVPEQKTLHRDVLVRVRR